MFQVLSWRRSITGRAVVRAGLVSLVAWLAYGCGNRESASDLAAFDQGLQFIAGDFDPDLSRPVNAGAGVWKSQPATLKMRLEAAAVRTYLATSYARNKYGEEATGALRHYFSNTGLAWEFDGEKLLRDVPAVSELVESEIGQAADFASSMSGDDVMNFSSTAALGSRIRREDNLNWYLAIGSFQYYITGQVDPSGCAGSCRRVTVYFHFHDRYDWDAGPVVNLQTPAGVVRVDQRHIGEFHRQGLAREFTSIGVVRREFNMDRFD